jgi:hypothetical protein
MNVAGAVSFAVRADDVRASTGCARCGASGPTREVNLARRPVGGGEAALRGLALRVRACARCFERASLLRALWVVGLIVAAIAVMVAVAVAQEALVDKSWLRAHSGAVVGIDALVAVLVILLLRPLRRRFEPSIFPIWIEGFDRAADTFTLGATSPEILARVLPGGPPYRPEPPDPALRRAGETVGRLGNPIDRLQEEILAPPRHQKVPGWVFIVLGLGPIIGAYPYAQEVRHGGRIKVVLLPFYWLGGKWGVFGALLAMGLLFVAIGVRRYLRAFRQPPTRHP